MLNNADFLLPSSALMEQALRDVDTRSAALVELFGEALDALRHPGTVDDLHYALLRKKYEKIKVDLVMLRGRGSITSSAVTAKSLAQGAGCVLQRAAGGNCATRVRRRIPPAFWLTSTLPLRSIWHCACTPVHAISTSSAVLLRTIKPGNAGCSRCCLG